MNAREEFLIEAGAALNKLHCEVLAKEKSAWYSAP